MPVQKAPEVGFGIVPTGRYMGDVSGSVPNGVGPVLPGDYFIDKSTTPTVWIVNVGAALSSNATIGQIISASTTTVVPLSSLYTGQGVILAGTTTAGSPTAIPQGADGTAPIYRSTVANGVVAQAVVLSSRYATQALLLAGTSVANTPATVAQGADGQAPIYRSTTATGFLAQSVLFSSQFPTQGQILSGTTTANSPAVIPTPTAGQQLVFRTSVAAGWNPETVTSVLTTVACQVSNSVGQSINNSSKTLITWDTEQIDTNTFHSTSSNTGRMTIPTGQDGTYRVFAQLSYSGSVLGNARQVYIRKNNTTDVAFSAQAADGVAGDQSINAVLLITLVATDYLEVYGFQNSTGALNVEGDNTGPGASVFSIQRIGS